jgi:hypothetical protein
MAVLDTSGLWSEGDDYRLVKALAVPFGSYTLSCVAGCMNDLQAMSVTAQQDVLDLLAAYEAAEMVKSEVNLADTEGKTLIKADVLMWQVNDPSQPSGPQQEMVAIRDELSTIFAFCSCLQGLLGASGAYSTPLIRS